MQSNNYFIRGQGDNQEVCARRKQEDRGSAQEAELINLVKEIRELTLTRLSSPPPPLRVEDRPAEESIEETHVVERPAWQAFITAVQLHNYEIAQEIDPAHKIGMNTQPRVTLSPEGIDSLNFYIDKWYGKEVEVVTTKWVTRSRSRGDEEEGSYFENPFRPVTGLRVIVTPTQQWSAKVREERILREREDWGFTAKLEGVRRAYETYVLETPPLPPPSLRARGRSPKSQDRQSTKGGWRVRVDTKRKGWIR